MVQSKFKHRTLSENACRLERIITDKLEELNASIPESCIRSIVSSLDLKEQYRVLLVQNLGYMNTMFVNGYRHFKTDTEDYITRYTVYPLYGNCRPGYMKSGTVIAKPYIKDDLIVGVRLENSFGYSKDKGMIYDYKYTLVLYKGGTE